MFSIRIYTIVGVSIDKSKEQRTSKTDALSIERVYQILEVVIILCEFI